MAQVVGVRDTRQSITAENVLVRMVGEDMVLLEPNATPLITFLMKLGGRRKPAFSPRIEWLEDDYNARWAQMDGTTVTTTGTTIGVVTGQGLLFTPGDLIVFPNASTSATVPEQIRVVSISTDTLTVVRGTGAIQLVPDGAIRILGSADEEGANTPTSKSTTKVTKTSYTQIFRTSMNVSKTQAASRLYGSPGGERKSEQKKKLVEHKQKMNAQALFGRASESLTGGPNSKPIRTTMGINSIISTNSTDAGGLLTQKLFETFSRAAFRYGDSKQKLLLCAPIVKSAINQWGQSFLNVKPGETMFGVNIQRVETAHGVWTVANDWMLENGVAGKNGFGNMALSIDLDACEYYYLNENGENRDTRLLLDTSKGSGADAYVDEYLTEAGFCFKHEKRHARLFSVADYAA